MTFFCYGCAPNQQADPQQNHAYTKVAKPDIAASRLHVSTSPATDPSKGAAGCDVFFAFRGLLIILRWQKRELRALRLGRSTVFVRWFNSLSVYADRRIWPLGLLGFSSGLPLLLTGGTLGAWLKEDGLSLKSIGLFSWVATLYSFKVLWAPIVDRAPLPIFTRLLGQRRGWMAFSQIGTALGLAALALSSPKHDAAHTVLCAVIVAFFSATQDVVIDAFRVERAGVDGQAHGAAIAIFGYRIGMLAAGAGALFAAEYASWPKAYGLMALLMLVGLGATIGCAETQMPEFKNESVRSAGLLRQWRDRIDSAVIRPFADFTRHRGWLLIILFVIAFKFGDALAAVMINPFLLETGFTKAEIAGIGKTFGLAATLVGAAIGGALVHRVGLLSGLWIGGILQVVSLAAFSLQALIGHDLLALSATIGFEYAASAIGTAAFAAYLSSLCSIRYTATQYALLTSLAAVARGSLASSAGWLAQSVGWTTFFLLTAVAALPSLLLLVWLQNWQKRALVT